jgi:hypothetical protein
LIGGCAFETGAGGKRVERLADVGSGATGLDVGCAAGSSTGAAGASATGVFVGVGSLRVVDRTGARGG